MNYQDIAGQVISHIGGKLMLFTASASTIASAPTKNRDAPAHYNSDREAALRNPSDPFFNAYASECIAAQISVDIFAASAQYLDLYSLTSLPRSTGLFPCSLYVLFIATISQEILCAHELSIQCGLHIFHSD